MIINLPYPNIPHLISSIECNSVFEREVVEILKQLNDCNEELASEIENLKADNRSLREALNNIINQNII